MTSIITAGILTFAFTVFLFGPGLLAAFIQWMLRRTHVPRSDAIIAILYVILDVTMRREYTADRVESLSSTLRSHGVEQDHLAMGFYLMIMFVVYLLLIKFGMAIIRGVIIIYDHYKKRLKDCQHAPPVQASPH